jgi:hypothetical protein
MGMQGGERGIGPGLASAAPRGNIACNARAKWGSAPGSSVSRMANVPLIKSRLTRLDQKKTPLSLGQQVMIFNAGSAGGKLQ